MSRVDVIIPCYKYGHYLRDCVRSVLSQEGVQVRVLILDDASPDHTERVGAELAALDPRVTFRKHRTNQGHIATYNEGLLGWATADYSLLLSADDLLAPGALGRAVGVMDRHPEVGFTYGLHVSFGKDGAGPPASPPCQNYRWKILTGEEFLGASCAAGCTRIESPTAVVRTKLQQRVGGYIKELPHSGDTEMWLRFATHGPVAILDAVQAFKREHAGNMSAQYVGAHQVLEQQAAFEAVFAKYGDLIPDLPRLRRLLGRVIAEEIFWGASRAFDRGDVAACRRDLGLAASVDPGLRLSPPWRRLRLKRFLGPKVWSLLRPLVCRLRTAPRLQSTALERSPIFSGAFSYTVVSRKTLGGSGSAAVAPRR
jgi:glycosyltransferase involved in cell wall biosynthesis